MIIFFNAGKLLPARNAWASSCLRWRAGTTELPRNTYMMVTDHERSHVRRGEVEWSGWPDLNGRPHAPHACALPAAPHPANITVADKWGTEVFQLYDNVSVSSGFVSLWLNRFRFYNKPTSLVNANYLSWKNNPFKRGFIKSSGICGCAIIIWPN